MQVAVLTIKGEVRAVTTDPELLMPLIPTAFRVFQIDKACGHERLLFDQYDRVSGYITLFNVLGV